MCHAFLSESMFYQFLFRIDQEIADQVRLKGCTHCGGRLHVADETDPVCESPVLPSF